MRMSEMKHLFVFGLIVVLISAACNLPVGGDQNQESASPDEQATIVARLTEMEDAVHNEAGDSTGTETADPGLQTTVTATISTPNSDLPTDLYQGFMVHANGRFISYDFTGTALGFDAATITDVWIGDNDVSVFPDQVYYSEFGGNSGVFRVTQQGSQQMNFIDGGDNPVSIAVSPDGSLIAWSTTEYINNSPQTNLYLANIDGSNQRMIAQIPAAELTDFMRVYYPYRWTEDGKLLYATALNGIGGYLLFWGYNGMFLYDTTSDSNSTIIADNERLGLCLSSISNDLRMAAIVCGNSAGVRVRHFNDGSETLFPVLADQGSAGAAKFSPSGDWLAYVIQRVNPDDELGKVVVVPIDGSAPPRIIAEVNGTYTVEGWYDDDNFLVTRSDNISNVNTVWQMNREGGHVAQLVDGQFLGFIR